MVSYVVLNVQSSDDKKSSWDVFNIVSDAKSFWKKQGVRPFEVL